MADPFVQHHRLNISYMHTVEAKLEGTPIHNHRVLS